MTLLRVLVLTDVKDVVEMNTEVNELDHNPFDSAMYELYEGLTKGSSSDQLMRIYALIELVSCLSAREVLEVAANASQAKEQTRHTNHKLRA
jgi:hypothetical protein